MYKKRSRQFVLFAVVLAFLAPAVGSFVNTEGLRGAVTGSVDLRFEALEDRVNVRRRTRQYWQAIEVYQNRVRDGETDLIPPTVDDYQSILWYLREESDESEEAEESEEADTSAELNTGEPEESVVHEAAPTASSDVTQQMNERDRHLLRRYVKANMCPERLKDYLPGFYDLCNAMAKDAQKEPRQGLVNLNQQLKSAARKNVLPNTIKSRLQMMEQALDRSTRRTDLPKPMRYEPTYQGE